MVGVLALGLVGCVVGGGEESSWTFDEVTAVDVSMKSGGITIWSAHEDQLAIWYDGGGLGGAARPEVFQADGTVVVDGRGGLGGGNLEIEVPAGVPITAILDRGDMNILLDVPSDIDACLAAGELSIGVPPGPYDIEVEAGAGRVSIELEDDPDAEHFIRACAGAGEIRLYETEPDAHDD